MSENESKKIRKRYTGIAMGVLGVVAAFIIYSAVVLKSAGLLYQVVVTAGIAIFWAIMDILTPIKAGEFAGKTPEQMAAYRKYAALDLVGYGGLVFFALAVAQSAGIYGAFVYVVARFGKKRFQDEYEGITDEEEDDGESAYIDVNEDVDVDIAGEDEDVLNPRAENTYTDTDEAAVTEQSAPSGEDDLKE